MMEASGGSAHIAAEAPFSFKASVAILGVHLKDCDMDGVVVSVARPVDVYKRTLAKRVQTSHPPLFVEISASPEESLSAVHAGLYGGSTAQATDGAVASDVTVLSAFEPDRITSSVREALQKSAQKYGGEEHFVLMDDLAAMEAYNGTGVVRNFAPGFFKELASLGIFTFVVLPEAQAPRLLGPPILTTRWKLRVTGALLADA